MMTMKMRRLLAHLHSLNVLLLLDVADFPLLLHVQALCHLLCLAFQLLGPLMRELLEVLGVYPFVVHMTSLRQVFCICIFLEQVGVCYLLHPCVSCKLHIHKCMVLHVGVHIHLLFCCVSSRH